MNTTTINGNGHKEQSKILQPDFENNETKFSGLRPENDSPPLFPSFELPYLYVSKEELNDLESGNETKWGKLKRWIKSVPRFDSAGTMQILIIIQIIVPFVSHVFGIANFAKILGFDSVLRYLPAAILTTGFELFSYFRTVALNQSKIESYAYIFLSTGFSVLAWQGIYLNELGFKWFPFTILTAFYLGLAKTLHSSCVRLRAILETNKVQSELRRKEREELKVQNPTEYQARHKREKRLSKEDKQSMINFCLTSFQTHEGVSVKQLCEKYSIKETTAHKILNQAESVYNEKNSKLGNILPKPNRRYSKRNTATQSKKHRKSATMKDSTKEVKS